MGIEESILNYKEDMIYHLSELIKIKSVRSKALPGKPYGEGCYNALEYILTLAKQLGFTTKNVDGYMGYAEYGEGEEYVTSIAHLDVVPEGNGWSLEPYGGVVKDGKIYGRGSSDNKVGAIVSLYALKILVDMNVPMNYKVRLLFGCAEETDMTDIQYYFDHYTLPVFGIVPDVGYSICSKEKGIININIREKISNELKKQVLELQGGDALNIVPEYCYIKLDLETIEAKRLEMIKNWIKDKEGYLLIETDDYLEVKAIGSPAHGAAPQAGVNAIGKLVTCLSQTGLQSSLLKFLNKYIGMEYDGASLGIACEDKVSGKLTLNLGVLELDNNVLNAKMNIRYPVTIEGENIINQIKERVSREDLVLTDYSLSEPLNVDDDCPWITVLKNAYKEIVGDDINVISIAGGTYARKTGNRCVGYGGIGAGGHSADEYVVIEDLIRHTQIITRTLEKLVGVEFNGKMN